MSIKNSNLDKLNPKLYCLHYRECDPKKCTSIKLDKFNLLRIIPRISGRLNKAVILNPFSEEEISKNDRDIILQYGLIVIDCSWKKLLNFKRFDRGIGRKLPALIAANPINYGKWEKLSSAEALAAALIIAGFEEYAQEILAKFSWGGEFLKLNNLKK